MQKRSTYKCICIEDIYSVGDRKQDFVRERNVDGETTDRYTDGDAS